MFRSVIIVLAIAIVAAILFPTTILGEGVSRSVSVGSERLGADLMVAPPAYSVTHESALVTGNPSKYAMDGDVEGLVTQVEGVEKVSPQLYFATLASG
jgi:putative ABC transport system permease protein